MTKMRVVVWREAHAPWGEHLRENYKGINEVSCERMLENV